jgi:LacI family sucrose operon transcriptional repressor
MPGIKDVADKAGVSVTTVSRVLNNRGYISEETRQAVYSAMKELNYYPNELARSLYKKRAQVIGLVIPDISHPFFSLLSKHVEIELYSRGYKMMLCNTIEKSNREREYLSMLQRRRVDGIIIGSHTLEFEEYEKLDLPIVTIDQELGKNIPVISSNHHKGGIIAARKLIDCGCKKVAQIMGYSRVHTPSHERHRAFASEMKNKSIPCITIELEWNQFTFNQYSQPIKNLFDAHPDIDGVFAVDMVAAAVMKEASSRNIKIPSQLKIVGYDGTDLAAMVTPSITTIKQPIPELAVNLVGTIIKLIEGQEIEKHNVILDVELIEGGTT